MGKKAGKFGFSRVAEFRYFTYVILNLLYKQAVTNRDASSPEKSNPSLENSSPIDPKIVKSRTRMSLNEPEPRLV